MGYYIIILNFLSYFGILAEVNTNKYYCFGKLVLKNPIRCDQCVYPPPIYIFVICETQI